VSAQAGNKASVTACNDQNAPDSVLQDGCIVKTCRSGVVEETLADECVQFIEQTVEEILTEKLAEKGPSYIYFSYYTIVEIPAFTKVKCDQKIPWEKKQEWGLAATVPYKGKKTLMLCGGLYTKGCYAWTQQGWEKTDDEFDRAWAAYSTMSDGKLLVTGGFGEDYERLSSTMTYSQEEGWQEFTPMPAAKINHCQVTVGDKVYVIGGLDGDDITDGSVYVLSDGQWSRQYELAYPRRDHMCAEFGGNIYVIGGLKEEKQYRAHSVITYPPSVEIIDTQNPGVMLEGPKMPYNVYESHAVVHDDVLYVAGDKTHEFGRGSYRNVYSLGKQEKEWKILPVDWFDNTESVESAPIINEIFCDN